MGNNEDQRYLDSTTIVDAYEKASRMQKNRASALINMDGTLAVLEQIVHAAETSMRSMYPKPNEVDVDTGSGENKPIYNSGAGDGSVTLEGEVVDSNSCEPLPAEEKEEPFVGWTGQGVRVGKSKTVYEPTDVYNEAIQKIFGNNPDCMTAADIQADLERCWNCDLRAQFQFQIKPINFLSELMPLIDGIMDAIDQILDALEPLDILDWLCNYFKEFKFWCLADLLALLVAWQGLLAKYFGQMIRLALNWTFLVGPIIKWIVDMVASLLEQCRRILVAPLDCISGALGAIINFRKEAVETWDQTVAFAQMFPDFWNAQNGFGMDIKKSNQGVKLDPKWDPKTEFNWETGEEGTVDIGHLAHGAKKGEGANILSRTKGGGLPTGFEINMNDTLESAFEKSIAAKKAERKGWRKEEAWKARILDRDYGITTGEDGKTNWGDTSQDRIRDIEREITNKQNKPDILTKMLLSVNSAKAFINEFFANLLLAIKSLNNFIVGSLAFSIKISGFILMILDFIKLIMFLYNIIKALDDNSFQSLCDMAEKDPDAAKELMNTWFGSPEFNISDEREKHAEMMELFHQEAAAIEADCNPT